MPARSGVTVDDGAFIDAEPVFLDVGDVWTARVGRRRFATRVRDGHCRSTARNEQRSATANLTDRSNHRCGHRQPVRRLDNSDITGCEQ